MGLELNIATKFDGKVVPAFYVVDLINIRILENLIQIFGRIFVSSSAYSQGLSPIDNFNFVFSDMKSLLQAFPSGIQTDGYTWLKSLPSFVGATDKQVPAPVSNIPISLGA